MQPLMTKEIQKEFHQAYMAFMDPWKNKISMYEYSVMSTTLSLCVLVQIAPSAKDFYEVLNACVFSAEQATELARHEKEKQ